MEPIAVGFLVLIGTAALMGVVVGAIGGAVVWRARSNLVLGGFLTAGAYVLVLVADHPADFLWLRAKLDWGIPSVTLTFLIGSVAARWLEAHTTLRPNGTMLAALGIALSLGFLYLLLFRFSPGALPPVALGADACLIVLLVLSPRLVRSRPDSS